MNRVLDGGKPWHGQWIGAPDWKNDARPILMHPIAFRGEIDLPFAPAAATLRISGESRYRLWINGRSVALGPPRAWPQYKVYDALDIAPFLQKGSNAFALLLQPPTGTAYGVTTRCGLIFDGEAHESEAYEKSRTVAFGTDASWKSRLAHWISSHGLLLSLATVFQEHHAMQHEPHAWKTASLEKLSGDNDWQTPFVLGPIGTPPWKTLCPRLTKPLQENALAPPLAWRGHSDQTFGEPAANLARTFNAQRVIGAPFVEKSGFLDVIEYSNAEYNVFVFDFGRTRLVIPDLLVTSCRGAARLELFYDLALHERPTAARGFDDDLEGFCDSFHLVGGEEKQVCEAITARGFRFLTVRVAGTGAVRFQLACRTLDYPFDKASVLRCDDDFWTRVWQTSACSLRSSTTDVFVDTCARENVLWTLDACVAGLAAFHTWGETAMWRHCLAMIGQGIDEEGVPRAVVPSSNSFMILFDQTMHWVLSCNEYSMHSGDASLAVEMAPAATRFLLCCEKYLSDENLFVSPSFSWHWMDWVAIDKRPYSLPINALLLLACQAATKLSEMAECRSLHDVATRIEARLRPAIARFFEMQSGAFLNHLDTQTTFSIPHPMTGGQAEIAPFGLHGNVLATLAGCGTQTQRKAAMSNAAGLLNDTLSPADSFGPAWTNLLLHPLISEGYGAQVVMFLRRLLQPVLDCGAPTWPESFHAVRFNTAHGWGATVNSLMVESLIGLRPLEAGWKRFVWQPETTWSHNWSFEWTAPCGTIRVARCGDQWSAQWPPQVSMKFGEIEHSNGSLNEEMTPSK